MLPALRLDFPSLCGTGSLCLRFALPESCSEGGTEDMMATARFQESGEATQIMA